MDCSSCVINIDGILEDHDGIKESRTSYAKAQTEVIYNPEKIKPAVVQKLLKQAGYTSEILTSS
jgi:copper chaperone CopZ